MAAQPLPTPRMPAYGAEIVLRHGDPEASDTFNARDIWVYEHEGLFFMHYDAAGPRGWLAARAVSADGRTWTKEGPILDLGDPGEPDAASASYGTTYFDGRRWHMFYLGTPNATPDALRTPSFPYMTLKAEAADPRGPWRKRRDIVPFQTGEGTWYSDTASPGQILRRGDEYLQIFSAATTNSDGTIWRTLGIARTQDLDATWTVDASPLLPATEQVENASVYFEEANGLWYLFTNHVGRLDGAEVVPPQNSNEYTDAIWVYWSDDPTRFSPQQKAVVLDASNSGWSPRVIGLPSVIPIEGRLAVFFDGSIAETIGHGGRDVGVAWLDLPLQPPSAEDNR